jgi:hypothetical protein
MKTGQGPSAVAYNVQTAVDAKHKLVVHHELTNESNDSRSLLSMASAAKEVLGSDTLNGVADAGYSNGQQSKACEEAGITPYLPVQRAANNQGEGSTSIARPLPMMSAPTASAVRRARGARAKAVMLTGWFSIRPRHAQAAR